MFKLSNFAKILYRLNDSSVSNLNNKCLYLFSQSHNKTTSIQYYCNQSATVSEIPGLNKDVDVKTLTNGDPEVEKKLRVLVLEADVLRQEGSKIPEISFLKNQHWTELLLKTSYSQRKRYLEFLWTIEKKKENLKIKQNQARIEREARPEYVDDGHIRYGLNHNTFFIRIYDTTINHMYNNRLINATKFGQPLVIDCGYDNNMTNRECINCAKQIMLAFSENRNHDDPFDLHLCNVNPSKYTIRTLEGFIKTMYEPGFPLHVHKESYLNTVFPSLPYLSNQAFRTRENEIPKDLKDRIVYLTPHCREELREYDHDAIYIIGGIVDKINQEPLSLAKAKYEGLRMAKLPLDRYLQWGSGSGKSLTINQMVSILLDIKHTGDWEYALRHVPRRKVMNENDNEYTTGLRKGIERYGPSFDRNAKYRTKNKWNNDRRNYKENRTYDNTKDKHNSYDTKDLIKELMKS